VESNVREISEEAYYYYRDFHKWSHCNNREYEINWKVNINELTPYLLFKRKLKKVTSKEYKYDVRVVRGDDLLEYTSPNEYLNPHSWEFVRKAV